MLKIKLTPVGKKGAHRYRIVVMEENSKLTGAPVDNLGYWDPKTNKPVVSKEKLDQWIQKGALPTPKVWKILSNI